MVGLKHGADCEMNTKVKITGESLMERQISTTKQRNTNR
jgi:hypothetical protein